MVHVMSERWTVAHMMFPGFMSLTFDPVHLETSTSLHQMCRIDFFLATWDFLDLVDVVASHTNHVLNNMGLSLNVLEDVFDSFWRSFFHGCYLLVPQSTTSNQCFCWCNGNKIPPKGVAK